MKILLINKFLHPNGGAETYLFRLGEALCALGNEVQYFGMEHPERRVGNRAGVYTRNMDFHHRARIADGWKVIYSSEARRKIRQVLEDFCPDVCHLNNFNYQLTPSILLEIRKWSRKTEHPCRIVYTAHDYQLVCPNHMCRSRNGNCEACLSGSVWNCIKNRCIHGSFLKSLLGAAEGVFWKSLGVYRQIDTVICCSAFLKEKLDTHPHLAGKTRVMHNFVEKEPVQKTPAGDYVLYFGRFAPEKGVGTLLRAAWELPQISFLFAGSGTIEETENVRNVGFQSGEVLKGLIRNARFTVCPSEWYENCPFSVLESLSLGTPVLGARIGGIPELIRPGENGELFESGNVEELKRKLRQLWESTPRFDGCLFDTAEEYAQKLMKLYGEKL